MKQKKHEITANKKLTIVTADNLCGRMCDVGWKKKKCWMNKATCSRDVAQIHSRILAVALSVVR